MSDGSPPPTAMRDIRAAARAAWPDGFVDLSRSEPLAIAPSATCAARVQEEFLRAQVYSPPAGLGVLRGAIARDTSAVAGVTIDEERVTATCGATGGLALVLAVLGRGTEVLVPSPYYQAYPKQVALFGGDCRFIDTSADGGVLTADAVRRALKPTTGALLLCNPSNPAGVVLSRAQLAEIVAVLPPSVAIIADEVYRDYLYEGTFTSVLEVAAEEKSGREVVVLTSASKTAGMPGWRVGGAVSSAELARKLAKAAAVLAGPPSTPAQIAFAAWLDDPPKADRMAPYRTRLRDASAALASAGVKMWTPQAGYYVWAAPLRDGIGSPANVLALARETGVLVGPGQLFGDERGVRISLSVPRRDLTEGLQKLTSVLAKEVAR